jgi:hypothetical protein
MPGSIRRYLPHREAGTSAAIAGPDAESGGICRPRGGRAHTGPWCPGRARGEVPGGPRCRGGSGVVDGPISGPAPGLPRRSTAAGAPRRPRSYVLASLRALHLDPRLVASKTSASRGSRNCRNAFLAVGGRGQGWPTSRVPGLGGSRRQPSSWGQLKTPQPPLHAHLHRSQGAGPTDTLRRGGVCDYLLKLLLPARRTLPLSTH